MLDDPAPLAWEAAGGGDERLKWLLPQLTFACTERSAAPLPIAWDLVASHVSGRTGFECAARGRRQIAELQRTRPTLQRRPILKQPALAMRDGTPALPARPADPGPSGHPEDVRELPRSIVPQQQQELRPTTSGAVRSHTKKGVGGGGASAQSRGEAGRFSAPDVFAQAAPSSKYVVASHDELKKLLRQYMEASGTLQTRVAILLGISQSKLSVWLNSVCESHKRGGGLPCLLDKQNWRGRWPLFC